MSNRLNILEYGTLKRFAQNSDEDISQFIEQIKQLKRNGRVLGDYSKLLPVAVENLLISFQLNIDNEIEAM